MVVLKQQTIPGIIVVPCRVNGPRGIVKTQVIYDDQSLIIVDTGAAEEDGHRIRDAIVRHGLADRKVALCVITHRHPDHTGGLKVVAEWAGCPVAAHTEEAAAIEAATGIPVTVRLSDDQRLDAAGNPQVFHCPGHTAGNLVLYDQRSHTLIAGDTVFSAGEWLLPSPPFLSEDTEQARQSVQRLLDRDLPLSHVLVAHGDDVYGWGAESLRISVMLRRPW
jgi:glyoxylase-like metal-dependent hydrolase (beta-lactamase superfamily II)